MKKSFRKGSKSKVKFFLALGVVILLGVSAVAAIFLSGGLGNSPTSSSPNPETPNPTSPSETTSTPPNYTIVSPPSPQVQIKILNKQIPSGYVMGLPVDGGLINGMNVMFIQNPNDKISIRFTAKHSGTATKLIIFAFAFDGQPTVRVGLQEDQGGTSTSIWMNESAFGKIQLGSSSGFKEVQLGTAVTVSKGQVYHVVIEAAENPLKGTAAINTYQADGFAQPFNPDDPDIVWNDPSMNTLFLGGGGWQEQNKWPIFVIGYSDGSLEGQPYSLSAQWVVWGSTYVGQTIVPASDYRLGKIAFDISLGSGVAKDKLYYQVRDSSNKILADGVFAELNQLSASQTWKEVTLATPITLKAGELYRIVVFSPQSDLANAIYFYGHEFSFDPTIGYGALQHQLTSSLNGGATWGENPDADAIFKITTTG